MHKHHTKIIITTSNSLLSTRIFNKKSKAEIYSATTRATKAPQRSIALAPENDNETPELDEGPTEPTLGLALRAASLLLVTPPTA